MDLICSLTGLPTSLVPHLAAAFFDFYDSIVKPHMHLGFWKGA